MKVNQIIEMASPRQEDLNKIYYHGVTNLEAAKSIAKNGLDPHYTVLKYGDANPRMRPVADHVYVTPKLEYAAIYALGGDYFGSTATPSQQELEKTGDMGYVFSIKGSELKDISPDEDDIGHLIYTAYHEKLTTTIPLLLKRYAEDYLTPIQLRNVKDGDYTAWAACGKKLMKKFTDKQKLGIISYANTAIAHKGKIQVDKCWSFSKIEDVTKIKRDCSNFFDIAKQVTL